MKNRLMLIAMFVVLAATTMHAQQHEVQTSTTTVSLPTAPTGAFAASTERSFEQLMDDAMRVMHRGMHTALRTGDPDRDFVTLMIPHHQGAIDMAKTQLLYSTDPQMRRLAQEIITDQQSEIALMHLWLQQRVALAVHPGPASDTHE
jgi:uncharacterized protein (DUF305 family)